MAIIEREGPLTEKYILVEKWLPKIDKKNPKMLFILFTILLYPNTMCPPEIKPPSFYTIIEQETNPWEWNKCIKYMEMHIYKG